MFKTRSLWFVPVAALLLMLIGLVVPVTAAPTGGGEIPLTVGWYEGRSTYYYSFTNPIPSPDGGATVTAAPIYVFFYGDGTAVPGQHNVVDVIPGETGYSDLWQVHQVTVPDDYVADSVRSYADIVSNGYTVTPLDVYVNCPIVDPGTTLEGSEQGLVQGWHDDAEIYYFDFGMNPTSTAPIYVLFYDDGTMVPDQMNIVDTIPGEADYSDFWQVHMVTVPDDYVANSAQSLADIQSAGYAITETDILVNCPIVRTEEPAQTFELTDGWYRNQPVNYYSFANPVPSPDGGDTVTPAPIYVFFYGDGTPVPDQHNVIDVVPGDDGYSDLWQVFMVTVPDDYVADSVRSYVEIMDSGYTVTETDIYVNCPVVPEGSTLEGSTQETVQGWYKGQSVFYFDFGMNPTDTAPIYVFFYDDGTMVPDQENIIDTIPGADDYSAFWNVQMVTVPDDYVANSIRSAGELMAAGFPINATDIIVNCPVNEFSPTDVSLTGLSGASSSPAGTLWLSVAALLAGVLVVGGITLRRRNQVVETTME